MPISGRATIPVSTSDVSGIPAIALAIPDFEGSAVIRMFSNATQTQIACFSAVMRNGATFSHPTAVGTVLGIFTVLAVLSSFATAIYGFAVPSIRTHYAHSLSILVVFEVFHSIFFSGALSLNWPSVLPAFWSNFAWSAGMIHSSSVIRSINSFTGVTGNSSQVGGAGSTVLNNNGGLQQQIYGRSINTLENIQFQERSEAIAAHLYKRAVENKTDTRMYSWAGIPVTPGLPLPGNWSGFAGTLSIVEVPAADAFLNGLIWFLVLICLLALSVAALKWLLEGLSSAKVIREDRLIMFRSYWRPIVGLVVLRTFFIAFFAMMTLTLFQFSSGGKAGPTAVAVIVFLIFFIGTLGAAYYACFYRSKFGKYESRPDRLHLKQKKLLKFIPWFTTARESTLEEAERQKKPAASVSFFKIDFVDADSERQNIHENDEFTKRFGWLSARYRSSRWWFFAFWVIYQFVRACFIGGARATPAAQVIGLFIWEFIAFIVILKINPFEGARNTAIAVWILGFSKVATAGLSIGFLPQFNLARIPTTIIGVIIIVIQGFMVIGLIILICLGAISSYMSLTRNHEEFKPKRLEGIRLRYFEKIQQKASGVPPTVPEPPVEEPKEPISPREPYFEVKTVKRAPKIEDEAEEFPGFDPTVVGSQSQLSLPRRNSRANSVAGSLRSHYSAAYGNVPFGARVHRASWSSRDLQAFQQDEIARGESPFGTPSRSGTSHTNYPSISMAPLVRSTTSQNSMRPITPNQELQTRYSNQRLGQGK